MGMFISETAGVISLTVGLVSTCQISEIRKCVHSNLHTHCSMPQRVLEAATYEKAWRITFLLACCRMLLGWG